MAERPAYPEGYARPRVWAPEASNGGQFAGINQPTAGARSEEALQKGEHQIQLYSLGTPNGQKVTILLEELGVEYDAWVVNIMEQKQFTSGFTECNPNQKIPTLYDYSEMDTETGKPLRVFESGAMLLYLADKYQDFVPPIELKRERQECLNWLFWQTGTGPYMGGGLGHFFAYAPLELQYPIDRYAMEVKRELDVLNRHFGGEDAYFSDAGGEKKPRDYILGDQYSIADIAIFCWVKQLRDGYPSPFEGGPKCGEFLDFGSYTHVNAWLQRIEARPAVQRGLKVNTKAGVLERHSKSDFSPEAYEVETWFEKAGLDSKVGRHYAAQLSTKGILSVADLMAKPMAEWGIKVSRTHDPKIQEFWKNEKAGA